MVHLVRIGTLLLYPLHSLVPDNRITRVMHWERPIWLSQRKYLLIETELDSRPSLSLSLSLSLAFRVSFIFISFSVWNAVYYSVVEAAAASSIDGLVGSYDGSPFLSPVSDCDIFFHYLCLSGGWRSGSPSLLYSFSSCWKGHVEAKRIKRKAIVSTVFSSFFSSSFKSLNNRSLLYWFLPFERRDHALRAKRSHRSSFPSSYNLFSHSFLPSSQHSQQDIEGGKEQAVLLNRKTTGRNWLGAKISSPISPELQKGICHF